MRSILALLHRWSGLFIALFLFVDDATCAVIAWYHELLHKPMRNILI